jgi:hypothetical protein
MKKFVVYYKSLSPLIEYFIKNFEYEFYKEPIFFKKIISSNDNIDIFFHSFNVKIADLKMMEKSRLIIVNSNAIREEILNKSEGKIKDTQVLVVFSGHDIKKFKKKFYRQLFLDRYKLNKETSIVYYTGKNLEKTGVSYFLEFVGNLSAKNFIAAITLSPDQFETMQKLLEETNMKDKVILVQEDLFRVSDIFILPTSNKIFAHNIMKAMASKNVVFLPKLNHASELLDNFSIMLSPEDPATIHKVNMLLENKEEMKKIQKQNYKFAKQYSLEKQCDKLKLALSNI